MTADIHSAVERAIGETTHSHPKIVSRSIASGGCINHSELVELDDGRTFFVKANDNCPADMFEREADGLKALASTDSIRVPEVVAVGREAGTFFLVLEAIESGRKSSNFFDDFGERLANLHRNSTRQNDGQFGWHEDNYLGSTPQPNLKTSDWVEFWLNRRLGFQFGLVRENGLADSRFSLLADRLLNRLRSILTVDEKPTLIHGDLWSGNFMVGSDSYAILIDPAVYFAHREAEFGMTTLFGGFNQRFYDAYHATWPLSDGSEERIAIYRLYHLLNHVNLSERVI